MGNKKKIKKKPSVHILVEGKNVPTYDSAAMAKYNNSLETAELQYIPIRNRIQDSISNAKRQFYNSIGKMSYSEYINKDNVLNNLNNTYNYIIDNYDSYRTNNNDGQDGWEQANNILNNITNEIVKRQNILEKQGVNNGDILPIDISYQLNKKYSRLQSKRIGEEYNKLYNVKHPIKTGTIYNYDTFLSNANNIKNNPNINTKYNINISKIRPNDISQIDSIANTVKNEDIIIPMGHAGSRTFGIPNDSVSNSYSKCSPKAIMMGTCASKYTDRTSNRLHKSMPNTNIYNRDSNINGMWQGTIPNANNLIESMYSIEKDSIVKPQEGVNYIKRAKANIESSKYNKGGKINKDMIHAGFKSKKLKGYIPKLADGGLATDNYGSNYGSNYGYNRINMDNFDTDFDWMKVVEGGVSGAAAGSVVPGWGTLIGGVVGAGVGALDSTINQQGALDERDDARRQNKVAKGQYDRSRMFNYNQGIGQQYSYYKKGGKIGMADGGYVPRTGDDLKAFEKEFARSRDNRVNNNGEDTFMYDGLKYHNYTVEEYKGKTKSKKKTTPAKEHALVQQVNTQDNTQLNTQLNNQVSTQPLSQDSIQQSQSNNAFNTLLQDSYGTQDTYAREQPIEKPLSNEPLVPLNNNIKNNRLGFDKEGVDKILGYTGAGISGVANALGSTIYNGYSPFDKRYYQDIWNELKNEQGKTAALRGGDEAAIEGIRGGMNALLLGGGNSISKGAGNLAKSAVKGISKQFPKFSEKTGIKAAAEYTAPLFKSKVLSNNAALSKLTNNDEMLLRNYYNNNIKSKLSKLNDFNKGEINTFEKWIKNTDTPINKIIRKAKLNKSAKFDIKGLNSEYNNYGLENRRPLDEYLLKGQSSKIVNKDDITFNINDVLNKNKPIRKSPNVNYDDLPTRFERKEKVFTGIPQKQISSKSSYIEPLESNTNIVPKEYPLIKGSPIPKGKAFNIYEMPSNQPKLAETSSYVPKPTRIERIAPSPETEIKGIKVRKSKNNKSKSNIKNKSLTKVGTKIKNWEYDAYYNRNIKGTNEDKGLDYFKESISLLKNKRYINKRIRDGFAKGGAIPMGAGLQVKGKAGTDTIPMNIDGQQVRLDNNEIVVRDYEGNAVVISDDLGEADKYRQALSNGANPNEVALEFAERAKRLNPNPGSNRQYGGSNPYNNMDEELLNYSKNYSFNNKQSYNNENIQFGKPYINKGFNINTPKLDRYTFSNNPANQFKGDLYKDGIRSDVKLEAYVPPSSKSKFGQYMSDNPTALGTGLGFAATTLGNVNSSIQLNKSRLPAYQSVGYMPSNIDANRPIFNQQIADTRRQSRNVNQNILDNTSNSNVALARLGAVASGEENQINRIRSTQVADRNRIGNSNTQGMNRTNLINNRGVNDRGYLQYQDRLGRINTQNALIGSTVESLENIMNNKRKTAYQTAQLDTIAKSYGLNIVNGKYDPSSLTEANKKKLLEELLLMNNDNNE